jgi:hypothetical protein
MTGTIVYIAKTKQNACTAPLQKNACTASLQKNAAINKENLERTRMMTNC